MKLKLLILLLILIGLVNCSESIWVVPENPNPQKILLAARNDVLQQNYQLALLKYIWIHQHSLRYDMHFAGVKHSYALNEWYALGNIYPKARDKFNEFKLKAEQNVRNKIEVVANFADYQSFNRLLGQSEKTINLLLWIEKNSSTNLKSAAIYAKQDLYEAKKFDLFNKYLDPVEEYQLAEDVFYLIYEYDHKLKLNIEKKQAKKRFLKEVIRLVTVLIHNNRQKEAQDIISKASKIITDPKFEALMNEILKSVD